MAFDKDPFDINNPPDPKPVETPEQRAIRRRKAIKRRLWFYGIFFGLIYFFLWYQPYEFDWVKRKLPNPNPMVDPDTKLLFARGTRILVVTAHPDDSEFFVGGLLSKLATTGADLHQVICTDGDKGYYWIFTNAERNRRVRQAEARAAAAAWNAKSVEFLGYPDRFLHANDEVVGRIEEAINKYRPEFILTFDGQFPPRASHQDHRRAGDATRIAAERTHVAKWLLTFQTIAPNYIFDSSDYWEAQKKLLLIHKSQFYGKHIEGVENMIASTAEMDGERAGFSMGEGLHCLRLLP